MADPRRGTSLPGFLARRRQNIVQSTTPVPPFVPSEDYRILTREDAFHLTGRSLHTWIPTVEGGHLVSLERPDGKEMDIIIIIWPEGRVGNRYTQFNEHRHDEYGAYMDVHSNFNLPIVGLLNSVRFETRGDETYIEFDVWLQSPHLDSVLYPHHVAELHSRRSFEMAVSTGVIDAVVIPPPYKDRHAPFAIEDRENEISFLDAKVYGYAMNVGRARDAADTVLYNMQSIYRAFHDHDVFFTLLQLHREAWKYSDDLTENEKRRVQYTVMGLLRDFSIRSQAAANTIPRYAGQRNTAL